MRAQSIWQTVCTCLYLYDRVCIPSARLVYVPRPLCMPLHIPLLFMLICVSGRMCEDSGLMSPLLPSSSRRKVEHWSTREVEGACVRSQLSGAHVRGFASAETQAGCVFLAYLVCAYVGLFSCVCVHPYPEFKKKCFKLFVH